MSAAVERQSPFRDCISPPPRLSFRPFVCAPPTQGKPPDQLLLKALWLNAACAQQLASGCVARPSGDSSFLESPLSKLVHEDANFERFLHANARAVLVGHRVAAELEVYTSPSQVGDDSPGGAGGRGSEDVCV
jgi:hypothetical protein